MKIKERLINALGGYTAEEYYDTYQQGQRDALESVKSEMDGIHGTPAEEWAGHMYTSICMRLKMLTY